MDKDKIDLVLLYVNKDEQVWQQTFLKHYTSTNFDFTRYRDWGLFKYVFRGIDKYLPFINKVHLVVSNIEQVPTWVDDKKVHIVLHKDIIPKEFLPTFNSVTIEFFLYNIPGLTEQFIYMNDDMYLLNSVPQTLIFNKNKPCLKLRCIPFNGSDAWHCVLKKVNNLIFAKFGKPENINNHILLPPHGPVALTKTTLDEVWGIYKKEILNSLSPIRDANKDLSPYLYSLYQAFSNNICNIYPNSAYVDGKSNFNWLRLLEDDKLQYLCINDEGWSDFGFTWVKNILNELFSLKFSEKSKYEK